MPTIASPAGAPNFKDLNIQELEEEMQRAIQNEDYERAARIRDELNKR